MGRLLKPFVPTFVLTAILSISGVVAATASAADNNGAGWSVASAMHRARGFATATELPNGNILVAGGYDGSVYLTGSKEPPIFPDTEIYSVHTGSWATTASMHVARAAARAVRLTHGRVLVIGGFDSQFNSLGSAEIYDSRSGTWSVTGTLNDVRGEDFTAVVLSGGRVLVAGGYANGTTFPPLNSAEIWDPRTGLWTRTTSMNDARGEFTTTVLKGGRVLVAGGLGADGSPIASAELYDPSTGAWTRTGSLHVASFDHSAVLLQDGRVLVAGGSFDDLMPRLTRAEIYDPETGAWTTTGSMTAGRSEAEDAAVRLNDGRVLIAGGFANFETPQASSDLYDPETGTWTNGGTMSSPRSGNEAVVLRGDRGVLVIGGLARPPATTASVDLFVPAEAD